MAYADAFNWLLDKQSRSMSIQRLSLTGVPAFPIRAAPSNYSRYLAGPGATKIEGYEFVISLDTLKKAGFPVPIRINDRLIDPDLNTLSIREIDPMYSVNGQLVAFRVRTG